MGLGDKAALRIPKRRIVRVPMPGLWPDQKGAYLCCRELTAGEKSELEERLTETTRKGKHKLPRRLFRATYIQACACDDDGKPYFEPEEIAAIAEWPTSTAEPFFAKCVELNRITEEDEDFFGDSSAETGGNALSSI